MTTTREEMSRSCPRPVVRLLWVLYRAPYRVSGDLFGLTRPKAGKRFGMMRLNTVDDVPAINIQ